MASEATKRDIARRAIAGGYPESIERKAPARRNAWFDNYLTTVIQRELDAIVNAHDHTGALRTLRSVATRSGGPVNVTNLSRDTGIPQTNLRRNLALLKALFLISEIPAWSSNVDARIMKSPKLLLNDSGLFAYLTAIDDAESEGVGFLIETFVGNELIKAIAASDDPPRLFHFRDSAGREVDYVLEHRDRRVVGIEVKRSTTVTEKDFAGIDRLRELAGRHFVRGIVLYGGSQSLSFGKGRAAMPVAALWR